MGLGRIDKLAVLARGAAAAIARSERGGVVEGTKTGPGVEAAKRAAEARRDPFAGTGTGHPAGRVLEARGDGTTYVVDRAGSFRKCQRIKGEADRVFVPVKDTRSPRQRRKAAKAARRAAAEAAARAKYRAESEELARHEAAGTL